MSFSGDIRHTPGCGDPRVPLLNLSGVQARMDNLQKFLSDSVNSNTLLSQPQMDMVSSEITSAIHQIIVNGSALLTSNQPEKMAKPKVEIHVDDEVEDYDIIEMDAVELLAEHVHFCEICGKGFKRDANLRMHMRAHGNQFKTPEALAKPEKAAAAASRGTRFSCPYVGCNRNKQHKKFRPLKSAICVKNHFKRSHCPKMYTCTRCNLKSFSVVTDLKSHLKHCGESKWRCSCGTTFSRKDKLFGHMELFEGHMPAVVNEVEEKGKSAAVAAAVEEDEGVNVKNLEIGNGFFEGLLDEFDSIENYCFRDVNTCGSMEGLFNF